jgi:hypothetical protein
MEVYIIKSKSIKFTVPIDSIYFLLNFAKLLLCLSLFKEPFKSFEDPLLHFKQIINSHINFSIGKHQNNLLGLRIRQNAFLLLIAKLLPIMITGRNDIIPIAKIANILKRFKLIIKCMFSSFPMIPADLIFYLSTKGNFIMDYLGH